MKDRTPDCLWNYNTRTTVGLTSQTVVNVWTTIWRLTGVGALATEVSPFVLFGKDRAMSRVFSERTHGYTPSFDSTPLLGVGASLTGPADVDDVVWLEIGEADRRDR